MARKVMTVSIGGGLRSSLAPGARQLAPMHLSIRVPWHDAGWNGTVCQRPDENQHCLILPRVAKDKDDAIELGQRGRSWNDPGAPSLPACAAERGAFMAPRAYKRIVRHPYAEFSERHKHFADTPFEHPAWSAACVPFRWLLRSVVEGEKDDAAEALASRLRLPFDPQIEPELTFDTDWIQHRSNQLLMLDTFFGAIQPGESLCFFYAKRTPLSADPRRVIVGVGRATKVDGVVDYRYRKRGSNDLEGLLWERNVHHSIRPGFEDGFVLPYAQLLEGAAAGADLTDLTDCIAFAPEEHWESYSYATEHLTHDGAVASLLSCSAALRAIARKVPGPWARVQEWISARLSELWKLRGAYPGFGAALGALDFPTPALLAHEVEQEARRQKQSPFDPWAIFEAALRRPGSLPGTAANDVGPGFARIWNMMPSERKDLLQLLSRFPLTAEQARRWYVISERHGAGIKATDVDILRNPYLLFELDRVQLDPIPLRAIDRGLLPEESIRAQFPVPNPSALEDAADPRRIHAATCDALTRAARDEGHTLLPMEWLGERAAASALDTPCPLGLDHLRALKDHLGPVIQVVPGPDGADALQLSELGEAGALIREKISVRLKGARHVAKHPWRELVDSALETAPPKADELERRARDEKAAALAELHASRFSLLLGGAGTGKTTLLRALCDIPDVSAGGVLLLAPTGKARVRLERGTKRAGQTVAQFLYARDRYQGETGRYHLSDSSRVASEWKTVIVDECSMLTEVQLAAVLQTLQGVSRIILAGDPRQLPPIGEGRPFADLVAHLHPRDAHGPVERLPMVGPGYAELTVARRQAASAAASADDREDLLLTSWFGGRAPDPAADAIWHMEGFESPHLRLVRWESEAELPSKVDAEIKGELVRLGFAADQEGFARSFGAKVKNGIMRFELGHGETDGTASKADSWQVLTPLRGLGPGAEEVNRRIKLTFRSGAMALARAKERNIPGPMGPQAIVYGDKVISNRNGRRWNARTRYPAREAVYVANGELGMVVGKFHRHATRLEVEFQSAPGKPVGYGQGDFEADAPLELAYALTVHKAQGSEFGTTFVILPFPCRLLSRELLYTALTRHQGRLVVLHQGPLVRFRPYASMSSSAIAQRLTNLFRPPELVAVEAASFGTEKRRVFLDKQHIHVAADGTPMCSKSEVIIAGILRATCPPRVRIAYEQPLKFPDGKDRYPDFTIWDDDLGRTFYWEHAGMMHSPAYRRRWTAKLAGYRQMGILPLEEGGGPNGTLVFTEDDPRGGLDAVRIRKVAERLVAP